ncbi:Prefoldin subunit-domain-containing protein [Pyrenochaeta sp. MPI-SDFR-AT-0127]|nr:Prefoldin subunit-domain-containing protein [Pyrenochaeta sp. MPI-SDFR-AT-0127]
MVASTQDSLECIERRRVQLQENVEKLRTAMSHWATWEAEYQMLKDEIQTARDSSPSHIREIALKLNGTLLKEGEVEDLLGKDKQNKRSGNVVVDLLTRRIDYVQQNSATIEKQLNSAEKQLAGVDVLLEPGMENEEGLPMMDIEEELDAEGNEVSSSINQTGESAAEVVEVLRKAGLQKFGKKKESPLELHGYNDDLAAANFSSGTKVIELDNDNNMVASYPIIPQGESPEDAELRRQMLQYGLSEVGQIVAELDLDRPTVSYSDDDDSDNDYDGYNSEDDNDDDEEEDDYGRSTTPVVTEQYRNRMLKLEQQLNARMLQNIGPQPDASPLAEHVGDIRTMPIPNDDQFDQSLDVSKPTSLNSKNHAGLQKGVRFAEDVDVSQFMSSRQVTAKPNHLLDKAASTITDTTIERSSATFQVSTEAGKRAKVSKPTESGVGSSHLSPMLPTDRFAAIRPVPTGPSGRTLANTITEHVPSSSQPVAPDEFNPIALHREIQAEFHKARNKFIQQQGGFKPTTENEERHVIDEDGNTKKVSRFRAARLKADGL